MSVLLIPCYEPDARLLDLIEAIRQDRPDRPIVVVDDGSGPAYQHLFDGARRRGCDVLHDDVNHGKGHALKLGFDHVRLLYPGCDVVCADCDGQHTPADVTRVADALADGLAPIVLGARQFVGDVPAKSRFGNTLTRIVFGRVTGTHLQDTQTGLRGYRGELLPWLLEIGGERFEYELDVLLAAQRDGVGIAEVPIATVYLDGNESSHFRPIADSVRVYLPFLKFSLASLFAFAVDAALLVLCFRLTGNLLAAVITSRVASASANFAINGRMVFDRHPDAPPGAGRRYALLAVALLGASYVGLRLLTWIGLPLLAAKVLTDLTLFVTSYNVQRRFVFGARRSSTETLATSPRPIEPSASR
ncbi:MAG: bifunctional glycosyltransferase family 2/GtrA family protein [Ilumatobacteraceae bacterium]